MVYGGSSFLGVMIANWKLPRGVHTVTVQIFLANMCIRVCQSWPALRRLQPKWQVLLLKWQVIFCCVDWSVQKAFMSATPGCIEHHAKLAAILCDTLNKHKSLAMCWLDLANAYGSVHHSLVHYHAPPSFSRLIQAIYDGLSASVMTPDWSTPAFSLWIGVYQGDPLSVIIFNTIINAMVDTLKAKRPWIPADSQPPSFSASVCRWHLCPCQ